MPILTLNEVRAHLRYDSDDAALQIMLDAAEQAIKTHCDVGQDLAQPAIKPKHRRHQTSRLAANRLLGQQPQRRARKRMVFATTCFSLAYPLSHPRCRVKDAP